MLAVGKVKPPYADDVAHYERLLLKQARVDVIEVADYDAIARRLPERAYVSLLDDRGEAYDSEAFARWLEQRRQAGLDVCFVLGGAYGIELERELVRARFLLGTHPSTMERIGLALRFR